MDEIIKKAFESGWIARGEACYPSPQDWEFEIAWKAFENKELKENETKHTTENI